MGFLVAQWTNHSTATAVRKQGNLLLCTLLLGNTVINSAISILMADLTTGTIGLLSSTFLILIFGEHACYVL